MEYTTPKNDSKLFPDIVDCDIIEKQDYPLLLSVMVTLNIPEKLDKSIKVMYLVCKKIKYTKWIHIKH